MLQSQTARLLETAGLGKQRELLLVTQIDVGAGQGSVSSAVLTSALRA